MIAITGATGQLGQLVVEQLLSRTAAENIVAVVRDAAKASALKDQGVQVRVANYDDPQSLTQAFSGVEKLLLVSSSEVGKRTAQHKAVIDAAKTAGISLIAYTSLLRAETSPMLLAQEHKATEHLLKAANLPYVLLRNGWYTENHTASLGASLAHGALLGAARDGRFATAPRKDYAEAAAIVLTTSGHENKTYELAGSTSHSYFELATEVSRLSGKPMTYNNLDQSAYETALKGFGLPEALAHILADSDAKAAEGALDLPPGDLGKLLGRATTPWQVTVAAALR
ncbi:MAG: SDR family oxidoreductase [Acidobacteriaceae bacterium]|nr:SDR family oxidoreductase [Acidobacteriaceae bacterium]